MSVELDPAGQPAAVRTGNARLRIETVCDVWRIDDEWWRHPIARRYAEVVLEGGKRVVLLEDVLTHEWFLQR